MIHTPLKSQCIALCISKVAMQEEERLYHEIEELERRIVQLLNSIPNLQEQYDLETRTEEKQRIDTIISDKKATITELEHLIEDKKPANYADIRFRVLISHAYKLKRNGAYRKARDIWQEIYHLDPSNREAPPAISALDTLLQDKEKIHALRKGLFQRTKDIQPIVKDVLKCLKNLSATDDPDSIIANIDMFLKNELTPTAFIENWEILTDASNNTPSMDMDYAAFSRRILQSELILFLGNGIVKEYDKQMLEETDITAHLAQAIKQDAEKHSLSSIAELYELRADYGRSMLLEKLHEKLPSDHQPIEFYHSLAKIVRPLLIISTAYDDLLEKTFTQHRKPYVVLLAIINRTNDHDIGNLVLHYSDNKHEDTVISEEELSERNLLEDYSIIYKIRGTCTHTALNGNKGQNGQITSSTQQNTVTLMESDYFRFAYYAERIIPNYIAKQFLTRAFLFLGYQPRYWEDRLIVNALLEKLGNSAKDGLMIGECNDDFEKAYWEKRNVARHRISIRDLDRHLKQKR